MPLKYDHQLTRNMNTLVSNKKAQVLTAVLLFAFALTSCGQQPQKVKVPTTTPTAATIKTVTIPIDGMACASCQGNVRKNLKGMSGVSDVVVSLEHRNATVTFDSVLASTQQLVNKINQIGYTAGKPKEGKQ